MKTIRTPLMIATALVAITVTTAVNAQYKPAGNDGISASPKVRQMLNERKASPAPAVTVTPAMACAKCAEVFTTEVNRQAKGAQILVGTATQKVAKHTCTACETRFALVGEGKAKHTVAIHTCGADVLKPATCCAMN
jgi:hypothetical protein